MHSKTKTKLPTPATFTTRLAFARVLLLLTMLSYLPEARKQKSFYRDFTKQTPTHPSRFRPSPTQLYKLPQHTTASKRTWKKRTKNKARPLP